MANRANKSNHVAQLDEELTAMMKQCTQSIHLFGAVNRYLYCMCTHGGAVINGSMYRDRIVFIYCRSY